MVVNASECRSERLRLQVATDKVRPGSQRDRLWRFMPGTWTSARDRLLHRHYLVRQRRPSAAIGDDESHQGFYPFSPP